MNRFISWMCFFTFASNFPIKIVADCETGCDLPIEIYEQLKCTPKFNQQTDCCPKEYDCSHIFNRTGGTCHLRGKIYRPDENVPSEVIAEKCDYNCRCANNLEFKCDLPQRTCHEYYVPDYPKDGCYLRYALDSCCATDQACPPFDDVTKCEVDGVTYKEGQRFPNPKAKCSKCVCSKGFDGKFTEPACQKRNCTTEIRYSKEIDKYCAPYYIGGTCCPAWWICPVEEGEYITSTKSQKSDVKCRFGEKLMGIGDKYMYEGKFTAKIICECVVPPFLSCFEQKGD